MVKFIFVLCALVACAAAKPGLVAPVAYSAPLLDAAHYPLGYTAPLAYVTAPLAYANAHLDAAHGSSRVDIRQNYNAAVVPTTLAAAPVAAVAPVATPLKYTAAVPVAYAVASLSYTNAHLDAAHASSRIDIRQNYNAAVVPTTLAAVAPVGAPLKYTAAAPVPYAAAPLAYAATPLAYANAHLDAAHASSRFHINQNYNAAFIPTTFAAVAPVAATPLKYTAPTSVLL